MRLGISRSKNGNVSNASAGNQKRQVTGVSGTVYDLSYMATMSESADTGLSDAQCSLSINNVVARTSNNIDTRTVTEKMFSKSDTANFKFSVYFTRDQESAAIEANKHLDRRIRYELDKIKRMKLDEYSKSEADIMKIVAGMQAKKMIADEGIFSITNAEWERALIECDAKAKPYGINTFELSCRASTRDTSLKKNDNAWGVTDQGFEAATYNAAGTKTLPLFDEAQVLAARKASEAIYREFIPMADCALKSPADYESMFTTFCNVCTNIDKDVPKDFRVTYNIFTDSQKAFIEKMAVKISNFIIGG